MFTNKPSSYLIYSEEITRSIQTTISWQQMDYNDVIEMSPNNENAVLSNLEQNSMVRTSQSIEQPVNEYTIRDIKNPILLPVDETFDNLTENSWKLIGKI